MHAYNKGTQIARRQNGDHYNSAKVSARVINTFPEPADEIYLPHAGWINVSRITSRRKYCSASIFNKLADVAFCRICNGCFSVYVVAGRSQGTQGINGHLKLAHPFIP